MHVLVIGGGSIGEQHARCFLKTGGDYGAASAWAMRSRS